MHRIPVIRCRRTDCRHNIAEVCERRWANGRRHIDAATASCPGFIRRTEEEAEELLVRSSRHPAQVILEA